MKTIEYITIVIAVISIIISTLALVQNSKMIESQTRPYISVYVDKLNVTSIIYYVIIKNVGASTATLNNISFPEGLINYTYSDRNAFKTAIGGSLSPGQGIFVHIDRSKLNDLYNDLPEADFEITYSSTTKTYKEIYHVKFDMFKDELSLRSATADKELKVISYAIQEFLERSI